MIDNVADLFAETLQQAGVHRVYGIVGDSLNAITEALRKRGEIDWVHVRHEEAAAFAAGAEAHLTGRLAVCAGSAGPGNLHLINGLFDAHRSRVPVLAIAAHIPSAEIGSGYFQETHPQELFRECSVYRELVSDPEQMPGILNDRHPRRGGPPRGRGPRDPRRRGHAARRHQGCRARGRPAATDRGRSARGTASSTPLAEMLNERPAHHPARRPGCARRARRGPGAGRAAPGPGGARARGQGVHRVGQPVRRRHDRAARLRAPGYYAMDRLRRPAHARHRLSLSAVLSRGRARIAQVDIRGEQLGRRSRSTSAWSATCARHDRGAHAAARAQDATGKHLDRVSTHYRKTRESLDELAVARPRAATVAPAAGHRSAERPGAEDAVFTADVGTPTIWAARHLRMNGRRRLVGSFSHGSMANALPQAIGAQSAFPGPPGRRALGRRRPRDAAWATCSRSASTGCRSRSWSSTTARWGSWSWR